MNPLLARRKAFTLIELLVVIAIISLLIAILMPVLSAARREAARVKCLAQLSEHGKLAAMNATDDERSRLHPPHERSGYLWVAPGDHDWGGGNGADMWYRAGPAGRNAEPAVPYKGAQGRFMNRLIYGPVVNGSEDFSLFRCPGDEGMVQAFDFMPPTPVYAQSVFEATGTSYQGDLWSHAMKARQPEGNPQRKETRFRFGCYNRPMNMIPDSSRTLLFWETRFMQAMVSTEEIGAGGEADNHQFGRVPTDIPGSHGKVGRFNVVFADGHAVTIQCRKQGTMFRPNGFDHEYKKLHWRAPDWRYDNFPAPFIKTERGARPGP